MADFVYIFAEGDGGDRCCPVCYGETDTTTNRAVAHLSCGVVLCSGTCSDRHAAQCRTGNVVRDAAEVMFSHYFLETIQEEQTA